MENLTQHASNMMDRNRERTRDAARTGLHHVYYLVFGTLMNGTIARSSSLYETTYQKNPLYLHTLLANKLSGHRVSGQLRCVYVYEISISFGVNWTCCSRGK